MSTSANVLKLFRLTHRYIGIFCAPALLFFAFTGALQTFSLHETTQGSSYKPPTWIVALGQLHKKQTTVVPVRRPRPAGAPDAARPNKPKNEEANTAKAGKMPDTAPVSTTPVPKPKGHLPMKIFFLIVAVGLFVSTLTGTYMSYKYGGSKIVVTFLLLAGVVVPLLLLPF